MVQKWRKPREMEWNFSGYLQDRVELDKWVIKKEEIHKGMNGKLQLNMTEQI